MALGQDGMNADVLQSEENEAANHTQFEPAKTEAKD